MPRCCGSSQASTALKDIMKLSLLLVSLLLIGCSGGPNSESSPAEKTDGSTPVRQAPTPVPSDTPTPPYNHQCHTESEWIDNCMVVTTICLGKVVRVDVMCSSDGDFLFPWKNIPDPPPPWVDNNSHRK